MKNSKAPVELLPVTPQTGTGTVTLTRLGHVRKEMASLYNRARNGKLTSQDASRLTFILSNLARIIEMETIERRLDKLEEQINSAKARGAVIEVEVKL